MLLELFRLQCDAEDRVGHAGLKAGGNECDDLREHTWTSVLFSVCILGCRLGGDGQTLPINWARLQTTTREAPCR